MQASLVVARRLSYPVARGMFIPRAEVESALPALEGRLKKKKLKHLNLFLAVLSLCCCSGFFPVVVSCGYSPGVVCRLLTVVASLILEHGLQELQLPVSEAQAQELS